MSRLRLRRGANQQASTFRYFFATDIHGSSRCFRKFLAAASVYRADALILGGDIAGKAIVPLIEIGRERFRVEFQGNIQTVGREELEPMRETIAFNGLYPYVCTEDEHARLAEDHDYRDEVFANLIRNQVESWCELATERLPDEVRCLITPGNDDPTTIDATLANADRIECPEQQLVQVGPAWVASLGNTNRTPWNTEREYDESELRAQIDTMLADADSHPLVFNFHCPPYGSGLDTVVALDDNFRPINRSGTPVEIPVGSTAVRDAILAYEPVVGLHGHIHESRGAQRIGTTQCLNPGSDYSSGVLQGALVELTDDGRYSSHLLTAG